MKCPNDGTHKVVKQQITDTDSYHYCHECKEDVAWIAKRNSKEWDATTKDWVSAKVEEDADEGSDSDDFDEYEFNDSEEADDVAETNNVPALRSLNDVLNLGGANMMDMGDLTEPMQVVPEEIPVDGDLPQMSVGTHRIVMESSDNVEGLSVMKLVLEVFGYNRQDAMNLMASCHNEGRAVVKQGTLEEMRQLMIQVRDKKAEISQSGARGSETILDLRVKVEAVV